ncbi:MAG: DNA polymerase II large subunit [Candidatus Jordarchaeum sp.]|uniref:DNA polymerase II large subunit n=1 Tax=Candidatus Jordarchaeum sp. TaxID=2823881 RepID=UPI00404B7546
MTSASDGMLEYFKTIESDFDELFTLAREARSRGYDPSNEPEILTARDVAARVEGLIGLKGVADRIRELSVKMTREEVAFKIAEEIVYRKFGNLNNDEEVADKSIRLALALLTEGVTAAPIEGIAEVKIRKNLDNTEYLAVYFAGPIRSAGGTEQAKTILVADFVRRLLHLDRYKPTDDEIERFVEEVDLYEHRVTHLQYPSTPDRIREVMKNLPVEVTGEPTDKIEVSGHRNLSRIETNQLRGGAILVLNDGLIGKASKLKKIVERIGFEGWEWLSKSKEEKEKVEVKPSATYLTDVIAGRPVFGEPSALGSFRLRYGRSRNTGLSAVGINPATMIILDEFLAPGTHIRTERPGKGAIVLPVNSIEGPIVKTLDGSVRRINTVEEANEVANKINKILFLGDLLIAYGEFLENNHPLVPSGYCEEWWIQELGKKISEKFGVDMQRASSFIGINKERLERITEDPFYFKPTAKEALNISEALNMPLHPEYTYCWHDIHADEAVELKKWLEKVEINEQDKIIAKIPDQIKEILERLGVPHKFENKKIIISEHAPVLLRCLPKDKKTQNLAPYQFGEGMSGLDVVKSLTDIPVREKAPIYIGARMGRPEKAKERKLSPPVHVLFPVGLEGGSTRNIVKAAEKGVISIEIAKRRCPDCEAITFHNFCPSCKKATLAMNTCLKCNLSSENTVCPKCGGKMQPFDQRNINLKEELQKALRKIGEETVKEVKGVQGLISESKIPEVLEKGVLRAKYDLYVYKDGTIRFDATDAPLTHFKPSEISVSVEKLRRLGYTKDYEGKPLENEEQIVELKPQDVIISENCVNHLARAANFIDELLTKFYVIPTYYQINSIEDLIGHLIIGLAPHTSVGIVGRIIGFTKAQVCYAHPYWHAAKRRNCDGDEDSIMLALDPLLNFSKLFLPKKRGGMMDTPLVIAVGLEPQEVDSESHNMDVMEQYPLEFYEKTLIYEDPKKNEKLMDIISHRLGKPDQYENFKFTHPTKNIFQGPQSTRYKELKTMIEKVQAQLELSNKIRASDAKKVAIKITQKHFIRDIAGNLKAFSTQKSRCLNCNKKYRRPPLQGKCPSCGGKLVLTVYQAGIEKYLPFALSLSDKFDLPPYLKQRLKLLKQNIGLIFEEEKVKQAKLSEFC